VERKIEKTGQRRDTHARSGEKGLSPAECGELNARCKYDLRCR